MDYKNLKRIVDLICENDLTEFKLTEENFSLSIKRGNGATTVVHTPSSSLPVSLPPPPDGMGAVPPAPSETPGPAADDHLVEVNSPMVGTFYQSPNPESKPFVSVGQEVSPDTVLCIVEAMKVMNDIKAECSGVVRQILVEDGNPVEYGQPLFRIEPN